MSGLFYFTFCLLGSLPPQRSGFHFQACTVFYLSAFYLPVHMLIRHHSCRKWRLVNHQSYHADRFACLWMYTQWDTGSFSVALEALGSFFCPMRDEILWHVPFYHLPYVLLATDDTRCNPNIMFSVHRAVISIRVFPLVISVHS